MREIEAREYLLRYRVEKKKMRRIMEQIQELRERRASAGSPNLDAMPKGGGRADLADYAAELDRLERELLEEQRGAGRFLLDAIRAINGLDDEKEREVLTLYYVRGYRWEDICSICGYSWRSVFRIRNRAIRSLCEVLEKTDS